ncbi:FkbM family methyltransferase [Mesorhizobium sp. LHD-90]|uniref:FkbM family methyltransferase n=1 Tax=Mesorhizobium sp. LHD-90 TaxID=3071414 RepID=UPI0027DEFBA4|nr:FkbM family methyltransferase [Mesorhizobium sp. LHD-90]MDQ6434730.1 FkbM family methyltransferase [Mesorhizobium sp. LHD-90]
MHGSCGLKTIGVRYAGHMVQLADLPEYRKFYAKLSAGQWEPRTLQALSRYLDRDTVMIDIGAWIGVTSFYGAQIAKSVVAVDPDPKCIAILEGLAAGCANVTVLQGALSDRPAVMIHAVDGFGSSETSILDMGGGESAEAKGLRLDEIMAGAAGSPAFVKIDIEGYEYALAPTLGRLKTYPVRALQLAVHPQLLEKSLVGNRLVRRLKTAYATWKLGRLFGNHFSGPWLVKYPGLVSYIVFGIVFRVVPRGADFLFEQKR